MQQASRGVNVVSEWFGVDEYGWIDRAIFANDAVTAQVCL